MKAEFREIQEFLKRKNDNTLKKQIAREKQRLYEECLKGEGIYIIKI